MSGTAPAAYCCVDGGGGNGDAAGGGCSEGGAAGCAGCGKGLAAPPCGVLAAVLVLETDLRGLRLMTGAGGGGTACNTTRTGFGTRVGGGFSQNECSAGSPVLI
jgi:hypothetical protein